MAAATTLGPEELRIIGHAINWQLNVPHERISPPQLSEQEKGNLTHMLADLCSTIRLRGSGLDSLSVEVGEFYGCVGFRMSLPHEYLRLMTEAVASFFEELRFSPTELEIVTGLPPSKTSELLSRLQTTYRAAALQPRTI